MSPGSEPALGSEDLAALSAPEAYPGDPSAKAGVEHVQTHLSHVFLTGERVYKFRKAVDLGFVCFARREERDADCLREVELNRRLAPDVYLGVAPLLLGPGGARIGEVTGSLRRRAAALGATEFCVVMRRLPDGRDAHSLLERGTLGAEQIERIGARIAAFHARHGLGRPAPWGPADWRERVRSPVLANFEQLHGPGLGDGSEELVRVLVAREAALASASAPDFERRRTEGRAVDGHGDLHLEHIWLETDDSEPLMIDCVEFDADLRHIDAASELAFPAMDLCYRGRADLGERLLRVYARECDDFDLYSVVDYFVSYRAGVRAKVAAIVARQSEVRESQRSAARESARRHLELATLALDPPRPAALWLVGGIVGTGKSTAAEVLADAVGGVVISSDRVRKSLAGLAPTARATRATARALYDDESTARTYAGLLERAAPVMRSGRAAILDATFSRRALRERAGAFAAECCAEAFFVEVGCAEAVAIGRLARRRAEGGDPSDAGPDLYAAKAAAFEPPDEWPGPRRVGVRTDEPGWRARLRAISRDLRS